MAHILVVEDCPEQASVIRRMLVRAGYQVEIAANGCTCLERVGSGDADAILLDLRLPDLSGLCVLQRLRDDGYDVPIAILTGYGDEEARIRAFHLGVDQFVAKPVGMEELVARVEALLRRKKAAANGGEGRSIPSVERFGDVLLDPATRSVTRRGEEVPLRPMEFKLLLALLRRRGAVATRLELLEEVWGYRAAAMTRTVDTHIAALRHKLEDQPSRPKYILTVSKAGYRLRRDPGEAG